MTQAVPEWAVQLAARVKAGMMTEADRLWVEPELIFTKNNETADPWQAECLRENQNMIFNCSRQVGKSKTASAIAIKTLLCQPPALVLIISPSERQSSELMKDKFVPLYKPWIELNPYIKDNEGEKTFANGSRLVALPGKSDANIRSYSSVSLMIIDEASRVPDSIYHAVTPMLAVSKGRQVVMSTPFGKRGWFYKIWAKGTGWKKVSIPATECKRLPKSFLDAELAEKGPRVFAQEYGCSFSESAGAVFLEDDISAALGGAIDGFDPFDPFGDDFRVPLGMLPASDAIQVGDDHASIE